MVAITVDLGIRFCPSLVLCFGTWLRTLFAKFMPTLLNGDDVRPSEPMLFELFDLFTDSSALRRLL